MKRIFAFLTLISGAFALNYHGVALAPDNTHGWAVCIDTVLIFHTTDSGATWQTQSNMPVSAKRFFDVCCFDQMAAWTCGMLGEILHTDNGGLDWYAQAIGL
ncbi:MAG: YCF48-related protein, partial [bacterium]